MLQVVAHGSYHSDEGIQLEKFSLEVGGSLAAAPMACRTAVNMHRGQPTCTHINSALADDARLLVQGRLLGQSQDATVLLSDFPMATLQPIFRAVPALQNAAPAVTAAGGGPPLPGLSSSNPFSGIALPFMRCTSTSLKSTRT